VKVVVSPDSFSSFLSAPAAAQQAVEQLRTRGINAEAAPLADGGEGTALALLSQLNVGADGEEVTGPDGIAVQVPLVKLPGGVFIETARILGRTLLAEAGDPTRLSSFGLGELLGFVSLQYEGPMIVGLGGSATMDGGIGMAQGLGLELLDKDGELISSPASARDLTRVHRIEGDIPLPEMLVVAWADVDSPLLDSATCFGEQKGATPQQIAEVIEGLQQWSGVVNDWRIQHGLNPVSPETQGAGAAGGLGFGLHALLDALVLPGAPAVARLIDLPRKLSAADVMITGEGTIDASSFSGKVVGHAVALARAQGIQEVGAIVGRVQDPIPPAPIGPDWIVACEDMPGDDRQTRFVAALENISHRLGEER